MGSHLLSLGSNNRVVGAKRVTDVLSGRLSGLMRLPRQGGLRPRVEDTRPHTRTFTYSTPPHSFRSPSVELYTGTEFKKVIPFSLNDNINRLLSGPLSTTRGRMGLHTTVNRPLNKDTHGCKDSNIRLVDAILVISTNNLKVCVFFFSGPRSTEYGH